VDDELIKWYPKLGTMLCPPEYNFVGETKSAYVFCPKCVSLVKGEYVFSFENGIYGWKLISSQHI